MKNNSSIKSIDKFLIIAICSRAFCKSLDITRPIASHDGSCL